MSDMDLDTVAGFDVCINGPRSEIDRLKRALDAHEHLAEMVETVIWMSGSADFSKEGTAAKGWEKALPKLNAALGWLNENHRGFVRAAPPNGKAASDE